MLHAVFWFIIIYSRRLDRTPTVIISHINNNKSKEEIILAKFKFLLKFVPSSLLFVLTS